MMEKKIVELASLLGKQLQARKLTLVTAESCTGGGIAQAITEIPGSSAWFDRGFVTYSNQSKIEMLGVECGAIESYGAVSEVVANQMAEGALKHSSSDLSISVTGIAGPSGGVANKPVGTVFIATSQMNGDIECGHYLFTGNRLDIRTQSIFFALKQCLENQSWFEG